MKIRLLRAGTFVLAVAAGALSGKTYLSLDDDNTTDGYASQVAFIMNLLASGGDLSELGPLAWIHVLRTAIAVFFQGIESIGGPALVTAVMLALIWPILSLLKGSKREYLYLLLPIAMLALSYRAALVFVSVGYLMLFLTQRRSRLYLVLSFLFANLSFGAVMSVFLIAVLLGRAYRPKSWAMRLYVVALVVSLVISAIDKYVGFLGAEAGYDATVEGVTGIGAILSRGTLFVSLLTGNYLRGFVYLVLFAAAAWGLVYGSRRRALMGYVVVFATAIPAFLTEGLGVVSLLVPVVMFMAGVPLPRRPLPPRTRYG